MVRKVADAKQNGKDTSAVVSDQSNSKEKVAAPSSPSFATRVRDVFGFSWEDFRSWKAASTLMHAPRDPASLGIFRILFGFAMLHDVFNERHMADLENVWHNERICYFTLFDFLKPAPLNWMYILHLLMAIGAVCTGLGLFFNEAIWLHIVPYWYVFFLDKTTWNNHTYLFGLVSTMLSFTSANHCYSLDALMNPSLRNKHVPAWNYGIFRFQFIVVYFIAGLKKWCDMDWMHGWSMNKLANHWVFAPFTAIIPVEMVNFLIVHAGGATLDLIGGWLLFFDKTRPVGIFLVQQFHLMNSQMFSIGMFPYVMLCTTPIFCYPEWPRRLSHRIKLLFFKVKLLKVEPLEPEMPAEVFNERCIYAKEIVKSEEKRQHLEEEEEEIKGEEEEKRQDDESNGGNDGEKKQKDKESDGMKQKDKESDGMKQKDKESDGMKQKDKESSSQKSSTKKKSKKLPILRSLPTNKHHLVTLLAFTWMAWQAFLPYSHFITKGYNAWTQGLYGYSWDMMIKTWSTQHVRVSFKEISSGEVGYLNPDRITEGSGDRWCSHPDMIKQFAKCVEKKFTEFNITQFKLHFDVWRSMTKRFQQRLIDPRVDLISADWSPFTATSWIMPVLSDLSDWRTRLVQIAKQMTDEAKGNEDMTPSVIFAADFPGLFLENYINEGLDNTTLELLQGEIEIEFMGLDGDDGEPEDGDAPAKKPHVLSEAALSGKNITLNVPGQTVLLPQGEYHRIHTIGSKPSCYMFVYENTTDKAEFKKERAISKKFETMVNASKEQPVTEGGRNFSDAGVVAEFFGNELSEELVTKFAERFRNMTAVKESRMVGRHFFMFMYMIREKFDRQVRRYSKALWSSRVAIQSIWEGRPMEEYLIERRKAEMGEKAEGADGQRNGTVDDQPMYGVKLADNPLTDGDKLRDDDLIIDNNVNTDDGASDDKSL